MTTVDQLIPRTEPSYQRWLASADDDVAVGDVVLLYGRESLPERNTTYEVAEYAPGYLLIGDDSGGAGFVIDATGSAGPVFRVDHGSLQEDSFIVVADTFEKWRASGFALPAEY